MPKKFPKILSVIFLTYFSLQLASFLFLAPQPARAVNDSMPKLQIPIPDVSLPGKFLKFSEMTCAGEGKNKTCSIPWIAEYISAVYKYAIGIVGILATVVMMVGGIIWLTAGGNATRVGEAKSWIGASLTGLVIALSSYMILYQINPDLIKLKPITIGVVEEIGGDTISSISETDIHSTAAQLNIPCDGDINIQNVAQGMTGKVTYKYGAKGYIQDGYLYLDCSGFASYIMECSSNKTIPSGTSNIFSGASKTTVNSDAIYSAGTLIGWPPGGNSKTSYGHVWISLGNGYFADAHGGSSSGNAVGTTKTLSEIINKYGNELYINNP